MSNDRVSTVGCSGTTCNSLAANSVFESAAPQPAPSSLLSGGTRKRKYKKRATKKGKGMKGGRKHKKSKKAKKSKKSKKANKRSRRGRSRKYKMRGGAQMMSNICHSAGYSIGDKNTELKPTEVGLAAGHFAPYTKTQNN